MSKSKIIPLAIETWEDADHFLAEFGRTRGWIEKEEAKATVRINEINETLRADTEEHRKRCAEIAAGLEVFTLAHEKDLDGRSKKLTAGTVGFRLDPPAAKPKKGFTWAKVVAVLRQKRLNKLLTFKAPDANKEAIKKYATDHPKAFENLPIEIAQEDKFYAEPTVADAATPAA